MESKTSPKASYLIRARARSFQTPPVHDALILGKDSPIGCAAIRQSLKLLEASPFEHIEVEDDVISDIIVRAAFLRRVPRDGLIDFVLERLKPLMGPEEILHLDLEAEVLIEESGR